LELFFYDFEGVFGLLCLGLSCFVIGYGDKAVFGGYGCFGVKPYE
jgi:hypothetical protein